MSTRSGRSAKVWAGAAVIVVLSVLAAVAVVLTARQLSSLERERAARAAAADAVATVGETMRTTMTDAASGVIADAQQVALADSTSAGVSGAVATRARDSGDPVLEDSGSGLVVVAIYDTPSPPESVAERRKHATGLRVAPMGLSPTLRDLLPAGGGIALAGPEQTILSFPGARPSGRAAYAVKLQPGPVQIWTLTLWTAPPSISTAAWLTALGILLVGIGTAMWFVRRDDRSRRSREELQRLQEASATTAALATVAQHSLDLADLLPALTTELADALGLQGLSLATPIAGGDRLSFSWGTTPENLPAAPRLPAALLAGETLCLNLARGGRTVARLRVVAGRDLDSHDVKALGAATEVLTSALTHAEAFAQQRDLVQRMKSVDELKTVFLATASHELRTPVGAISGYAQLLSSNWGSLSEEDGRMYAERVDSNARRLGALVDDLLDFSRLERGVEVAAGDSVLDLGETVTDILDERPDMAPDHQIEQQAPRGLAVVGSVQAVERVLSNLVGNAAKYSPSGTVIRVSVKQTRDGAELVVDDEGPGVPPAERDQIFSRFFRGQGDSVVSTRGVGLGLAIVSEFAASMGGQVSVAASPSGGARFVVSYPLAASPEISVEGAADVRT